MKVVTLSIIEKSFTLVRALALLNGILLIGFTLNGINLPIETLLNGMYAWVVHIAVTIT